MIVISKKIFVWGRSGAPLGLSDVFHDYAEPVDISSKFEDNKIVQISAGSQHCIALTMSGTVYSWGQNHSGQLAQGDTADRLEPEIIKTVTLWNATLNRKVVKVCVGELHSLMATSDGQLFAVGDNNDTNLGIGPRSDIVVHARPVLLPDSMIPVGQASSPRGSLRSASPGLEKSKTLVSDVPVEDSSSIASIDINTLGRHSMAVNHEGKVFSWGASSHGQLGHGNYESYYTPRPIISLEGIKIVQVACGWSHSLCLAQDGRVFAFGDGEAGKLGLGNCLDFVVPFTVNYFIDNKIKVNRICAGHFHSAAIDTSGFLYTWGSGACGVLGHGDQENQSIPKKVNIWRRLRNETNDKNENGFVSPVKPPKTPQKAPPTDDSVQRSESADSQDFIFTPPATPSKKSKQTAYSPSILSAYVEHDISTDWSDDDAVVSVASGAFHMIVATKDGSCFTWGKGDTYALGHGNMVDLNLPSQISALKQMQVTMVACGMNHSIAIANDDTAEQYPDSQITRTPKFTTAIQGDIPTKVTAATPPTSIPRSPLPQMLMATPKNLSPAPISMKIITPPTSNGHITPNDMNSEPLPETGSPSNSPTQNTLLQEYAKNAAVARELGSTTTAQAFEKAIYGEKPASVKRLSLSDAATSSKPDTQKLSSNEEDFGPIYEAAPVSKPMRISPAQRRRSVSRPREEDFPSVLNTWVNTVMDTAEYSLAHTRVDAEVAELRYMLSSGSKPDSNKIKLASVAKLNAETSKRSKRVAKEDEEESSDSEPLAGFSSSDEDECDVLDDQTTEITDPKEMLRRAKRDRHCEKSEGPVGLATSPTARSFQPSSVASALILTSEGESNINRAGSSLDNQTGMFSPFLLDRGSTPSSPLFKIDSSSRHVFSDEDPDRDYPTPVYQNSVDSSPLPSSSAALPNSTPSPLKFGVSYRIRDSVPVPHDDPTFSLIEATNALDLMPSRSHSGNQLDKQASSSNAESNRTKSKSSKKKTKSKKTPSATSGAGTTNNRFAQLFESMFKHGASDRLDSSQNVIDKASAAQESISDYWLTVVMPNWESVKRSSSIKRLWRRGIPANIRGVVWSFLIRNELCVDFNLYDAALKSSKMRFKLWLDGEHDARVLGQSVFHVIDVDVPRTHPETKLFRPGGPFYGDLVNLLHVYSAYDRDMSYVQGMSYLAAFFVTHCVDPFTAFRCFANLLNTHFFRSLFKMNLTQVLRHMSAYELLFERHLPKLFAHFKKLAVAPEQYLLDWFMTSFSRAFSLRTSSRIFDCLIIEGEVFLYRTALAILKLSEATLLAADFETLLPLFRGIARELDEEKLFSTINSIKVPKEVRKFIQKITREAVS